MTSREQMAAIQVGQQVQVPADRNHRLATVTEQSPGFDRWRIDWFDGHAHRWAWWDGPSLRVQP